MVITIMIHHPTGKHSVFIKIKVLNLHFIRGEVYLEIYHFYLINYTMLKLAIQLSKLPHCKNCFLLTLKNPFSKIGFYF
jgi:hypothetical protein